MRKLCTLLLLFVLCLSLTLNALADDANPMVVDELGIFSETEKTEIQTITQRIRDTYQMDAVVWTCRQSSMSDDALTDVADRYFEDNGYGLGGDRSGVLIMVDLGNRYIHISTAGLLIDYISEGDREQMLDDVWDYVRAGNYGKACVGLLERIERRLQEGIREGHFRFDSKTGERLTGFYNRLTLKELLLALLGGVAVAAVTISAVMARYSLKNSTYHFDKLTKTDVRIMANEERFLRRTVTRVKDPPPGSGSHGGGHGGFGGGGHSHGSGVHTSSGGMSHGGGGRHF